MATAIDSVITSSDLSFDSVLKPGLPIALLFHEGPLPGPLREAMEDIMRRWPNKVLAVRMPRLDTPATAARFGVQHYPTLVTALEGRVVTTQFSPGVSDLAAHAAFLMGEGPKPASGPSAQARVTTERPSRGALSIGEADFDLEVLGSDRPVLVDFWARWCGPCRTVAPTVEALAREQGDALKVVKVNVDESPGLAARFGAMSIPTMMVVVQGRVVDRWVGALPENALRSRVLRWLQDATARA